VQGLIRFLAWTGVLVGILIGVARWTAIRWWQIPDDDPELSASITPSLQGGDWVLLWRFTEPVLGDLVLCPDPDDPTNIVIGRIAAEAGDVIVLEEGKVSVNEHTYDSELNCTERTFSVVDPDSLEDVELSCDMEAIGERTHMRGYGGKPSRRRISRRVEVGEVFLLSDNRTLPFDSRHYGPMQRDTCKERIFFRLVSKKGFMDTDRCLTYVR